MALPTDPRWGPTRSRLRPSPARPPSRRSWASACRRHGPRTPIARPRHGPRTPSACRAPRSEDAHRAPAPRSAEADREVSADASTPARATPPGGRHGVERDRRQESGEALGSATPLDRIGGAADPSPGRDDAVSATAAGRDEVMSVATATPPAVPVSPTGSTEPPPPAPADPPPAPADPPPAPADRPPAPAGTADRVRRRQPSLRPPANEPAVTAPAAAPEVTISIGHIDVRAAPPPAPARSRPAFRPRVSLDEFLTAPQDRRP